MPIYDFDFQRYVERRKGAREAEAREGAAYAYGGDLKVLRTLDRVRPVKLALEATVRLWRSRARAELLGTSIKVSEKQFPRVHALARRAAEALHVEAPSLFVSPQIATTAGLAAYTFGTDDDAAIVLHAGLVDALSDGELLFAIGQQCGHVQNHHALYRTAQYFLVHSASAFLRWIVSPAVMALDAWSRRGRITADRAGLLAARDIDLAAATLPRLESPPADGAAPAPSAPAPAVADEVTRRVAALRVFADSAYYRGVRGESGGYPSDACDERVAEILSGAA